MQVSLIILLLAFGLYCLSDKPEVKVEAGVKPPVEEFSNRFCRKLQWTSGDLAVVQCEDESKVCLIINGLNKVHMTCKSKIKLATQPIPSPKPSPSPSSTSAANEVDYKSLYYKSNYFRKMQDEEDPN